MNLNHFETMAKRYNKLASYLLWFNTLLILIFTVGYKALVNGDEFTFHLADSIEENGVILGINSYLPLLIPGIVLFFVSLFCLKRYWGKKSDASCPHCKVFLLPRSHWVLETGHCCKCGIKLCSVTEKNDNKNSVILEEEQKLDIHEIQKQQSKFRKIIVSSLITGTIPSFCWFCVRSFQAPSEITFYSLIALFLSVGFLFASIHFTEVYGKKKFPIECPNCNKYVGEKLESLIMHRRCEFCHTEIIKKPSVEDDPIDSVNLSLNRSFNASEVIQASNLKQKQILAKIAICGFVPSIPLIFYETRANDCFVELIDSKGVLQVPLFLSPIPIFLLLFSYLKKKRDIDCPYCTKSLLLSYLLSDIINSGNCPHCGRNVIQDG